MMLVEIARGLVSSERHKTAVEEGVCDLLDRFPGRWAVKVTDGAKGYQLAVVQGSDTSFCLICPASAQEVRSYHAEEVGARSRCGGALDSLERWTQP